jgi:hypothetical protein
MSFATAGSFTDHPRKILFRQKWAKPILHFLYTRMQKKLIYLGIPGIRALDILEWKDFLRIVIAFQVANYNNRRERDEEAELEYLLQILNELEEKQIIETYALYTGYIEHVVMNEEDDNNEPFLLKDYITVYNLDFCNALSKPITITSKDYSKTYDCYKIDVIEKLLSIQKSKFTAGLNASFVMFLTVHASFVESMVYSLQSETIKSYIEKNLKGVTKDKRSIRLLKAYTFYKLNEIFKKHNFNIEILPTIYYKGSGTYYDKQAQVDRPFWLLTFTILGTPFKLNESGEGYVQDFKEYLENKFIFIDDNKISCFTENIITEKDFAPDIIDILSSSHTLTKLWSSSD